jgi:hypothetical protein
MLESTAQLIVVDPENSGEAPIHLEPIHVEAPAPAVEVSETHEPDLVLEININDIPGAPEHTQHPEPKIEVVDGDESDKADDELNSKKSKKSEWDWKANGATGFIVWVKERINGVPKHSGYDTAGLERAIAYFEKLDDEISRIMRLDIDGELDANQIEHVRSQLDHGLELLTERIEKVKDSKRGGKKKRNKKSEQEYSLIKEAQKITGVQGTYVTVPLLISGIARVCINGMVSAGHDIEQIYADQVKKYSLNEREKSEVRWLLFDMGYAMRGDRGLMPDDDLDVSSSDNYDLSANYNG